MADKTRFIVFGVRPSDTLLVECHTNNFCNAVMLSLVNSAADFRARIWDNWQHGFVKQKVIDEAAKACSQ